MEEEIIKKPVTPIGDFNCQSFPLIPDNVYFATEEELIKLANHELKWAKDEDGKPILIENDPTEENARDSAVQRIAELKKYLSETDYIVTKIAECDTEEEKAELKAEYQAKLVLRKQWRAEINELEPIANENE